MKNAQKKGVVKNRTKFLLSLCSILLLLLFLSQFYINNYSQNKQETKTNNLKYNDPLTLSELPKFNESKNNLDLPESEYQLVDTQNLWLSLLTESYLDVGFLNQSLVFKSITQLPTNTSSLKIYSPDKLMFVLESRSGSSPTLIYKNKGELFEIIALNPNEFFTGYYYSPLEQLFYISKGNSSNIFTLFYLKQDGSTETLLESTLPIKVLKPMSTYSIVLLNNECKTLNYYSKEFQDFDCNNLYLNPSNLNLITKSNQLLLSKDNRTIPIFNSNKGDFITGATFFNNEVHFVLNNSTFSLNSTAYKIMKSNLSGNLELVTTSIPEGDIVKVLNFNGVMAINKLLGSYQIIKLQTENVASYLQNTWTNVNLTNNLIKNIEILGPDYQI